MLLRTDSVNPPAVRLGPKSPEHFRFCFNAGSDVALMASLIVFGRRLSAVAGCGASGRRLPHIEIRLRCRLEPGDDCVLGGGADRAELPPSRHPAMSSASGRATRITVQFDLGRDIDGASLDVQTALATAARRLPVEMTTPPSFRKVNPGDFAVIFVSLRSDTLTLSTLNEYAETVLAPAFSQLSGVAQVQVFGAQRFAVRVQVPLRPRPHVSLDRIRTVVARTTSSAPSARSPATAKCQLLATTPPTPPIP